MNKCTRFTAALAAVLVTMTIPALAQTPNEVAANGPLPGDVTL